jgi:hypothetical protein
MEGFKLKIFKLKNMKIYLVAAIAAMLIAGTATAQHVNFGIKGGLNMYNIHNSNDTKYDSKIGYHIGLLAHVHMAQHFALQPEVVFSTQGAKYRVSGTDGSFNLDYINVPLLFQYMFDNGFRIQAGPQASFLINASSKNGATETDIKDNLIALILAQR